MWYGYLMPSINRSQWSSTEEDNLLHYVNHYSVQNWPVIAQQFSRRSPYQCFVHYHAVLSEKNLPKNVRWTREEDEHLIEMVNKYRIGNIIPWTKILETMPGRYKAQIYNRYMFSLNPEIKRDKFTVEEDCIIMAAVQEYGANFQSFPSHLLPGRSCVQIRNRYNNVLRHNGKVSHWTLEHDQQLIDLVERYGNKDWARIADEIQVHSRLSCRSRYKTIVNFLQQNPTKTIADVKRRKRKFSSSVTTNNWMETIIREKQKDQLAEDATIAQNESRRTKHLMDYINTDYGSQYYEFFKCAYNFRILDDDGRIQPKLNEVQYKRIRTLALLLAYQTPIDSQLHMRNIYSFYVNLTVLPDIRMEHVFMEYLRYRTVDEIRLPPNLSTVLGLRALSIMFDGKESVPRQSAVSKGSKKERSSASKSVETKSSIEASHFSDTTNDSILSIPSMPPVRPITLVRRQTPEVAIQSFKKRFRQLFFNAAILANISAASPAPEPVIMLPIESGTQQDKRGNRKRPADSGNEAPDAKSSKQTDKPTNYIINTDSGTYRITITDE